MHGRGGADLLAVVVTIGAAQVEQGAGGRRRGLLLYAAGRWAQVVRPAVVVIWCRRCRVAAQVVRVSLWACVVGAGLLLIRQGCGVAVLPFAGGVRFSTLPGSALGVGLELSEL